VVSDLSDLRRIAEKKLRERREFIERYSSLEDTSKLEQYEMDLRRKRGMLEEINRSVREMEEDERQLRLIRERDQRDDSVPIEPADDRGEANSEKGRPDVKKAAAKLPSEPTPMSAAPEDVEAPPQADE
jgi:hypothetical protein